MCNLKVNQWDREDKPWAEHKRLSPDCRYLKMVGYGESDQEEKSCEENRNLSFAFCPSKEATGRIKETFASPFPEYSNLFSKYT